jgi:hypothetical protein
VLASSDELSILESACLALAHVCQDGAYDMLLSVIVC